jgi:NADH-quinone oxidoreductase subunit H
MRPVPRRAAGGHGARHDVPGRDPVQRRLVARNVIIGLIMVFAFGSINVMALMLGGWASRNKYAIISAARIVSQNVAYEIPMLLVVITLLMTTGTMDLNEIIAPAGRRFWHWNIFRLGPIR